MKAIEENLYEFYRSVGKITNTQHVFEKNYEIVKSTDSGWPQMIFNLDQSISPSKLIPALANDIEKKNYPAFFVSPENYLNRNHSDLLKKHHFIPVKFLQGMFFSSKAMESPIEEGVQLKSILSHDQFRQFQYLVNQELLSNELPLRQIKIDELDNKKLQVYGLFKNHELISASLVLRIKQCAGLYFIVTKKEHQQKGYASSLIKNIIYKLYQEGINDVILHANNLASNLYRTIGFASQNRFVIYKKI